MDIIAITAQVGELVDLKRAGIDVTQLGAVYTVFDHELGVKIARGTIEADVVDLTSQGIYKEPTQDWRITEDGKMGYFSLIPRKGDTVTLLLALTKAYAYA